jgi:hypothetical protein
MPSSIRIAKSSVPIRATIARSPVTSSCRRAATEHSRNSPALRLIPSAITEKLSRFTRQTVIMADGSAPSSTPLRWDMK